MTLPAMTLTEILRAEIAASGPMRFRDFMARALYDPQHGYYASGRARIGRKGDYFTSVSVGPLFGTLLARQFAEVWEKLGRPADFTLVEQGAHDGTLAADVLAAFPAHLTIIEPSPHWRALQQQKLAGRDVRWVESVAALEPFTGVHFSNELLDAFPVHLVHRAADGLRERAVALEGDRFVFVDVPLSSDRLHEGEVNLAALDWIASLAPKLTRGIVLIIDYGHTRSALPTGPTLEAIASHRRVDPLATPGEADLTAHVDFTALAEATDLEVLGFTDQHHFLTGLARLHFVEGTPPDPRDARAFQTLSHPTMLGRAFKALALGRGVEGQLSGFAFARDPRAELGLT
ncbi:MAG: SAM-dependent methyltransferase [Chthoniobacteraceae bacterium]